MTPMMCAVILVLKLRVNHGFGARLSSLRVSRLDLDEEQPREKRECTDAGNALHGSLLVFSRAHRRAPLLHQTTQHEPCRTNSRAIMSTTFLKPARLGYFLPAC